MKIDRLIAITMYLLNRETVSASALAERFEVSKRTIQRDIETLNQAGIPIVSTYGSDGGYEIMDGFKLTKQIAGVDDYLNIIIALKGLSSAYDNEKINQTLEKALTAMQGGEQRIFIDFTVARERAGVNEYLKTIEKAIYDQAPLLMEYTNAENIRSERIIEPLALSYQWYAWYVFAYCPVRQDYRLFKLSRISGCRPAGGSFSKKHNQVETLMKSTLEQDKRKYYNIKLHCKKEIRRQAVEYLSSDIIEEYDNGDFLLQLHVPFERMWFSLLLGFGNQIEVVEPQELKTMLRQKAQEVLEIY
jgi:predicted DNA-binding transcriptional regulator YafY